MRDTHHRDHGRPRLARRACATEKRTGECLWPDWTSCPTESAMETALVPSTTRSRKIRMREWGWREGCDGPLATAGHEMMPGTRWPPSHTCGQSHTTLASGPWPTAWSIEIKGGSSSTALPFQHRPLRCKDAPREWRRSCVRGGGGAHVSLPPTQWASGPRAGALGPVQRAGRDGGAAATAPLHNQHDAPAVLRVIVIRCTAEVLGRSGSARKRCPTRKDKQAWMQRDRRRHTPIKVCPLRDSSPVRGCS